MSDSDNFTDSEKIDIVIPLKSVNRLIVDNIINISEFNNVSAIHIGDAGIDLDTKEKLLAISKVIIYDHLNFKSQGGSIKDLIQKVNTRYFAYLHGDVILPDDWFEVMLSNMKNYEFAECARKYVYEYSHVDKEQNNRFSNERPLSGSQMGCTKKVLEYIQAIEDDYLFRNEDIIIADLVKQNGGRYGYINDTHHIHQIGFSRKNENISSNERIKVDKILSPADINVFINQICGIVKYLKPTERYHLWHFDYSIAVIEHFKGDMTIVKREIFRNKIWILIYLTRPIRIFAIRLRSALRKFTSSERELFE